MRRFRRLLLWGTLGLTAASCEGREDLPSPPSPASDPGVRSTHPPSPAARPPRLRFDGCAQAGPGPTCVLTPDDRALVAWVDVADPRDVELTIDDVVPSAPPEPVQGGLRWRLDVPAGARRLVVRRVPEQGSPSAVLELRTAMDRPAPALLVTIDHAAYRDLEPARQRLERERSQWDGFDRLLAQRVAGSLAYRARDFPAAQDAFTEGFELARGLHRGSDASAIAQQLAFLCIEHRDFACARQWLERDATVVPFPTAAHLYYRGLLAEHRGDLGQAMVAYREAIHEARALGLPPRFELSALNQSMLLMAHAGDLRGAAEAMRSGLMLAQSVPRSFRALFLNTAAWSVLVTERGDWSPRSALELLDGARRLLGERPRGIDAWFTVRLNLAHEALERGATPDARRWLESVPDRELSRHDERWHQLLRARLEQLEGAHGLARDRLEALIDDAARHDEHDVHWAARVALAGALEQQGRTSEALAQYVAADRLVERWLPLLSPSHWDRFAASRDHGTRRRVALLTATGDDRAALCVARLARTRSLRAIRRRLRRDADPEGRRAFDDYVGTVLRLDAEYDGTFAMPGPQARRRQQEIAEERASNQQRFEDLMRRRGQRPAAEPECESLSVPPGGTVDLHYARLDRGWIGWSMDERGAITRVELGDLDAPLGADDLDALGRTLLDPFIDPLGRAQRVRVMATAGLHDVPFHALPMGDDRRRLQDHAVVVYGLDLPTDRSTSTREGPALVLEPSSNLPRAHQEARACAAGLRSRGATVEWLEDELSSDAPRLVDQVVEALPRASWLHYVGHARADARDGWSSELALSADGSSTLGVAEILALPRVPRTVVLSGCETGVVDPASAGGGMSLAHAFVLAGSQVVLATTHEVRDDQAVALMGDVYASLPGLDAPAVEGALRTAQRRAAAGADAAPGRPAWHLVRAWVP